MNPELQIDSSLSTISFNVQKLGFLQVLGTMSNMKGKIVFNKAALQESYIDVSIDTRTLDTRNTRRDAHLKGEDFFDVAHYPTMSFELHEIVPTGEHFEATGTLSIKGIEKTVAIPFRTESRTDGSELLSGSFTIDRTAFGIGGSMVGLDDEVTIHLNLPISANAETSTVNH